MKRYLLFLFLCHAFIVNAQTLPAVKRDTLREARLDNQLLMIQRLSAERAADSLKRKSLEQKVAHLSSDESIKRADLIHQLDSIKSGDSIKMVHQKQQVDSLRAFVKGFAVRLLNDTLFMIYAHQGSFTAQERASAVETRINKLANNQLFTAGKLKNVFTEQTVDLVYGDQLILSLSTIDAIWQHTTKQRLADDLRKRIINGIRHYHEETHWSVLIKEAGMALGVIIAAVLLIVSINRLARKLKKQLQTGGQSWFKGIHIRNYELVNTEQARYVLSWILNLIKWVLLAVIIYIAIPIIFGFFPFTQELSGTLFGYVLSPLKKIGAGIWAYVPNLITIIILVIVFRYVLRFFHFLKSEIERERLTIPGFYADWANPTYQIIRVLILAFMLIVVFPYLPGSDSPVFKGVSVFMGVLFTFGSAGALSNVVAGLVLTYMRAFKLGDRVKIGEVTGDVTQKTLLVTRIRTIKNEIISIPNSMVMNNHTVNFSSEAQSAGLILHTSVTIGYDSPWRQIHELLAAAALKTDLIEQQPAPFVLQTSLDDYYVNYQLNAYTRSPRQQAAIYSALHANIQDLFNEAGIEIMSPHYRALRNGEQAAMPPNYQPPESEN